jgi:plastocyanin
MQRHIALLIAPLLIALGAFHSASLAAAQLQVMVKDRNGKPVADAVVLALPADPKVSLRAQTPTESVDQVDKQFVPYVKVVFVGSTIRFPNSDNIRHQVYSFSPAKKFELPLYTGAQAQPVLFEKAGVVVLGCNIHDWMIGYVYVSETPFFAKTGTAGTALLADLPAGDYVIRVWQPSLDGSEQSTAQRIAVAADGTNRAEWAIKLKATIPVPRVSSGSSAAYP